MTTDDVEKNCANKVINHKQNNNKTKRSKTNRGDNWNKIISVKKIPEILVKEKLLRNKKYSGGGNTVVRKGRIR